MFLNEMILKITEMELYMTLNSLQRFQYHCQIEKMYIVMTTDINYIYKTITSYRIEIINPYDLNPIEKMKLKLVSELCDLGIRRIIELNNILQFQPSIGSMV